MAITAVLSLTEETGTQTGPYWVQVYFNGSVSSFGANDITVTNGTLFSFRGSGSLYYFGITPPNSGSGTTTISITGQVYRPGDGVQVPTATPLNVPYAQSVATAVLSTSPGVKTGAYSVSVIFGTSVTGFDLTDINVENGVASNLTGSGTNYTFIVTPNTGSNARIYNSIDITGQVTAGGTTGYVAATRLYVTTRTTVTATLSGPVGTQTGSYTVNVSFARAVTYFTASNIGVTNGTVSGVTGSGTSWSFTVNPTPNSSGSNRISLTGIVHINNDLAQAVIDSQSLTVSYNRIKPQVTTATWTLPTGTQTSWFTVSVTFAKSVTNFTSDDITIDGGEISNFTGSGTGWSFRVYQYQGLRTLTLDITGEVTVNGVSGSVTIGAASISCNRPNGTGTADMVLDQASPATKTGTFRVNVSDPGLSREDRFTILRRISLTNGVFSSNVASIWYNNLNQIQGYYFFVIPNRGHGTIVIDKINYHSTTTALSVPYSVDTVSAALSAGGGTKTSPYTVSVIFSSSVSGFSLSDISVSDGVASNLTGSGTTYSFTVTGSSQSGTNTIDITGDVTADGATGPVTATAISVPYIAYITTATLSAPSGTQRAAYTVTVTFGAAVTNFELTDIDVSNGVASNLSGSGTSWSFTVTPPATGSGSTTIDIDGNVTSGGKSGTVNVAELSVLYSQPALTGTLSVTSGTKTAAYTVTATFNQSVTSFQLTDINVINGVASSLSGSGTSWTFRITPPATGSGNTSIDITGSVTARGLSRVPTVSAISVPYSQVGVTGTLSVTSGTKFGAFYCFVSFSESVTNFSLSDISVSAGTKFGLTGSGAGYYFTVMPPSGEGTISIDVTGAVTARGLNRVPTVTALSVPYGEEQTVDNILWTIPNEIQQADNAAKTFSVTAAFKRDGANQSVSLAANSFSAKGISGVTVTHAAITNASSLTLSVSVPAGKYGALYLQLNSGAASSPTDYPGTAQFSPSILCDTRAVASAPDIPDIDNIIWQLPEGIQSADNATKTFTITANFRRNGAAQSIKLAANAFTAEGISGATATNTALTTAAASLAISVSIPAGKKGNVYLQLNSGSGSEPTDYPTEAQFSPTVPIDTTAVPEDPIIVSFSDPPVGIQLSDYVITATFSPAISDTAAEILAASSLEGGGTLAIGDINRVSDTEVRYTVRVAANQARRIQYIEVDTDQLTKR